MKVKWEPEAVSDRGAILEYIAADKPSAAVDVDDRILEAISSLKRFPWKGRLGRSKGTRELVIPNTRYVAAYSLQGDTVVIHRIMDGARRWPRKIIRH